MTPRTSIRRRAGPAPLGLPLALPAALLVTVPVMAQAPAQPEAATERAPAGREQSRLEQPESEGRRQVLEEVLVVGRAWRLPDLGSSWRAAHEAELEEEVGRIDFVAMPLYDPENHGREPDIHDLNNETGRVGSVEIFRLYFGGRR